MISVQYVAFSYDRFNSVRIDELEFPGHGLISVIGPNGAGKTTMLKLIAGIIPYREGSIKYKSEELAGIDSKDLALMRSYVPQNTEVHFAFTVRQFISFGMYRNMNILSQLDSELENRLQQNAAFLEIEHVLDKQITEISGGELQKAHIARALFQDTEIILLDEPVSNIDIHYRFMIMRKLRELSENHLIIYVTHDVNNALNNAHSIIGMRSGQVQFTEDAHYTVRHMEALYGKRFAIEQVKGKYIIIDEENE